MWWKRIISVGYIKHISISIFKELFDNINITPQEKKKNSTRTLFQPYKKVQTYLFHKHSHSILVNDFCPQGHTGSPIPRGHQKKLSLPVAGWKCPLLKKHCCAVSSGRRDVAHQGVNLQRISCSLLTPIVVNVSLCSQECSWYRLRLSTQEASVE